MAKGTNGEGHTSSNGESDPRAALLKSSAYDRGEMTKAKRAAAKDRFLKHTPAEQEVIMTDWEKHDETKQALVEAQAEIERLKEQIKDQKTELKERADQIADLIPFKDNKSDAIEREAKIRAAELVEEAIAEHEKKKSSTYKRRTTSLKDREEKAKLAEEAAKAAEARADAKLNEVMNLGELRAKAERLDNLEEQLANTRGRLEVANQGFAKASQEKAELESQLNTAQAEVKRLQGEVNDAMASVNDETARELTELREQVRKLTTDLEATVREKGDKHNELSRAKDEIQRLKNFEAEVKSLKSRLDALQTEIEDANAKLAISEAGKAEVERQVTQLTIDLKDCKRKYRLLNASYNSLQDNMKARAEDIENLREQLGS